MRTTWSIRTGCGLLLHGLGATAGPTLGGAKIDLFSLESLMLHFAAVLVLVLLVLSSWRYARRTLVAESASHKPDDVMTSGGSQAELQMNPRGRGRWSREGGWDSSDRLRR